MVSDVTNAAKSSRYACNFSRQFAVLFFGRVASFFAIYNLLYIVSLYKYIYSFLVKDISIHYSHSYLFEPQK